MNQVIRTEGPDNSGTNTILIVLLVAAVVAFGVWFFTQGGAVPAPEENPGINVDVNLPAGGAQNSGDSNSNANPGSAQ